MLFSQYSFTAASSGSKVLFLSQTSLFSPQKAHASIRKFTGAGIVSRRPIICSVSLSASTEEEEEEISKRSVFLRVPVPTFTL